MNLKQDRVGGGELGQVDVKDGLQDDLVLVILLVSHLDLGGGVQHSSHGPHAWKISNYLQYFCLIPEFKESQSHSVVGHKELI